VILFERAVLGEHGVSKLRIRVHDESSPAPKRLWKPINAVNFPSEMKNLGDRLRALTSEPSRPRAGYPKGGAWRRAGSPRRELIQNNSGLPQGLVGHLR